MSGFTLQQPWALLALALGPALALLFRRARRQRGAWLRAYGAQRSAPMTARSRERHRTEWCVVAATALLALALARPGANPRPNSSPEGGRDVIFVLDVSRSMLGEDVRPSRLERAKADIARCLDSLGNDRVGLVVFAGAAAIRCPLTTDYDFFRTRLRDTSPDSVPRGSTYIELGLEKTADRMLATNRAGFEDVILLTDGGDQGSHPGRTIAALNRAGARLLAVGYGDPTIGARVPAGGGDTNGFLVYDGQEVWTRLEAAGLQSLADSSTHGKYVHGGTPDFDLGRTYAAWSANAPRQFLRGRTDLQYDEYFGWLLVPALALLLYPFAYDRNRYMDGKPELTSGHGERGGAQRVSSHEPPASNDFQSDSAPRLPAPLRLFRGGVGLLLTVLLIVQSPAAGATNTPGLPAAAAVASTTTPLPGEPPFSRGIAWMKMKSYEDAAKAFDTAADGATTAQAAAVCRYNEALAEAALAARSPDPGAQLEALGAAVTAMRRARLLRPDWRAAAQGLEVLYARHAEAARALNLLQDHQNQMNRQASELQADLQRLLAEQKRLLADGTKLQRNHDLPPEVRHQNVKTLHTRQAELGEQTETVRTKIVALRATMRQTILKLNGPEAAPTPADQIPTAFDEPLDHLAQARTAQNQAAQCLAPPVHLMPAVAAKRQAVNELAAALRAMTGSWADEGDDSADDNGDSDLSESSQSDSAASDSMAMKGDFLSDPVNRSLPQPNFSPEDILQEEQANAQTRTKTEPARVGKGEKDW